MGGQRMDGAEGVTLREMLEAREARASRQRCLLREYGRPLLSFTMNLAGPVKRSRLSDLLFYTVLESLWKSLGEALLHWERTKASTGLEALLVCALPAEELKTLAVGLEEARPAGRLCDLDVLTPEGGVLSREVPRPCLVCGGPAKVCARSRAHGLGAVLAAADVLLRDFAAEHLAALAVEALIWEVDLTPKPGLVDREGPGAHRDMNLELFHRSAQCLRPYFQQAITLGLNRRDCMADLQQAGRQAEETMLASTGGVNTHKGAIYAFGLTLAALGGVLAEGGDVYRRAAALAKAGPPPDTPDAAERARYGAGGARGEALAGFPNARRAQAALRDRGPFAALLTLLSQVEDANLLRRGGAEGLAFVRGQAASILAGPPELYVSRLRKLDGLCAARNLSPGGSADLLALARLLDSTRRIWEMP